MENVVLLKDILKDNQYPEAGVLLSSNPRLPSRSATD